jgi:hypothetical protein
MPPAASAPLWASGFGGAVRSTREHLLKGRQEKKTKKKKTNQPMHVRTLFGQDLVLDVRRRDFF